MNSKSGVSGQGSGVRVGGPRLTLVVAASKNHVIGREGELPWRLPADLARFKKLTMGHPLIMGRKTYESIGRPLPGRVSIVLTRNSAWRAEHDGVLVADTLKAALGHAANAEGVSNEDVMVIGGGEVYRLALPHADRVELTRVHASVQGDAKFGPLDEGIWRRISSESRPADERNEFPCSFEVWERVSR